MAKLTVKQVLSAYAALLGLIEADRQNKYVLSSATRIKLAGNVRRAKAIVEDAQEARDDLIKKLGKPNKDGVQSIEPNTPEKAIFDEETKKALDSETDLEGFSTVTEEDLFGKTVKDKDGNEKPQNQIDIDALSVLLDVGVLKE